MSFVLLEQLFNKIKISLGYMCIAFFLIFSFLAYRSNVSNGWISFFLALTAVVGFGITFYCNNRTNKILLFISKYTMPIFLMHTLFAASLRVILLKIGFIYWPIHVVLGILASVFGPIFAVWIMETTRWLEFFIYPWKVIKKNDKEEGPVWHRRS